MVRFTKCKHVGAVKTSISKYEAHRTETKKKNTFLEEDPHELNDGSSVFFRDIGTLKRFMFWNISEK